MRPPKPHRRRVRRGAYLLPSAFTIGNMLLGFYALVLGMRGAFGGDPAAFQKAALLVFAAAVLDTLDGRIARLTGTESPFGREYDSLADAATFGMVPALLTFAIGLGGSLLGIQSAAFAPGSADPSAVLALLWTWPGLLPAALSCVLMLSLALLPLASSTAMRVELSRSGLLIAQAVAAFQNFGVAPHLVAGSLAAVTCQRLVRQICRICKVPADPPAPQTLAHNGISAEEAATLEFYKGKGCPTCNKVGYRGRRAIFEVMSGAAEVKAAILNGMAPPEVEAVAVGAGMKTLRNRCLELVRQGVTTFDEFAKLRLS